jgi:hypothetical protein
MRQGPHLDFKKEKKKIKEKQIKENKYLKTKQNKNKEHGATPHHAAQANIMRVTAVPCPLRAYTWINQFHC